MLKIFILLVFIPTISFTQILNSTLLISNLSTPESVVVDNGAIYVANIGGETGKSKGLGFITKTVGTQTEKLFVGKLDDPKGFAVIHGQYIIVSDHPNVKLLDLETEEVISTVSIKDAKFLNDLVLVDSVTALVSDTKTGFVHKIIFRNNFLTASKLEGINHIGINGLEYDSSQKKLYFVTSIWGGYFGEGDIHEAELDSNFDNAIVQSWGLRQIGHGKLDGIALVENILLVSDWKSENTGGSSIYGFDIKTRKQVFEIVGDNSIADFDIHEQKIYFPEFQQNTVRSKNIQLYLHQNR